MHGYVHSSALDQSDLQIVVYFLNSDFSAETLFAFQIPILYA